MIPGSPTTTELTIRFDSDFDRGAWIGEHSLASAGELTLGPLGLLDELELRLGVGGQRPPTVAQRVAALLPAVLRYEGFWNRSAAADPIGVAIELLRWRDQLALAGWTGESVGPRLRQLAQLESSILPGLPDRARRISAAVGPTTRIVSRLVLSEEARHMPRTWRRLLAALERSGTDIQQVPVARIAAVGDLDAAKRFALDNPSGDGSLTLLRPIGAGQAADEVASWLAHQLEIEGRHLEPSGRPTTLVVNPPPLLDEALHRYGLPTTGARDTSRENTLVQALPLVLEMGWNPPDPKKVVELLTLVDGPLPKPLTRRLLRALSNWPAVGSTAWNRNMHEGLAELDSESSVRSSDLLTALFSHAAVGHSKYRVESAILRAETYANWLESDSPSWERDDRRNDAAAVTRTFRELLDAWPEPHLEPHSLERLLRLALGSAHGPQRFPALAGIAKVATGAAIVGPIDRIIWWPEPLPRRQTIALNATDTAALAALGVALPDPAAEARHNATRWQRPLLCARRSLLFVAPELDEKGDPSFPHPLWDEITARLESRHLGKLVATEMSSVPRPRRAARSRPEPRTVWTLSDSETTSRLDQRASESPTGAAKLIGCPFSWALQYQARLYPPPWRSLSSGAQLSGNLAHTILAEIFSGPLSTVTDARLAALELFDATASTRAAALFLPGAETQRTYVREVIGNAASDLTRIIRNAGLEVVATEEDLELASFPRVGVFKGRADLVLGPQPVVVDYKWGSIESQRQALEDGTASQVAAYSALISENRSQPIDGDRPTRPTNPPEPSPVAAYYGLLQRTLLTDQGDVFRHARVVDGPPILATWQALKSAYRRRWRELDVGACESPWDAREDRQRKDAKLEAGELSLPPSCYFCELGVLCGKELVD